MIKFYEKNTPVADIDRVVEVLQKGGLVILPTDSVYAIACNALKERAVQRICQLKGINPLKNRLSIVCRDLSMASDYVKMDNTTFKLLKRNLPGAFTFILPTNNHLPKIFKNRKEVGIRMPDAKVLETLVHYLETPLMVASLPLRDDEMDYALEPELVDERYANEVDLVIDGGYGLNVESTIIDCTSPEHEIVRQGEGELME